MHRFLWLPAILLLSSAAWGQQAERAGAPPRDGAKGTGPASPRMPGPNKDEGPVDPGLVGAWQTTFVTSGGFVTVTLEIRTAGTYRSKTEGVPNPMEESGTFRASKGKWSLVEQKGPSPGRTDGGTYQVAGNDAIVLAGKAGSQGWVRVPGSAPAGSPGAYPANPADIPQGALKTTEKSLGPRGNATPSLPVVSPDDWHQLYVTWLSGASYVALDGVVGKEGYTGVDHLLFSADSKHTAFLALRGPQHLAVIDGVDGPPADQADSLQFSPDGKHVAYVLKWNQPATSSLACRAMIDGVAGPVYPRIEGLTFSPDSKHTAYVARRGTALTPELESVVVCDGTAGRGYFNIDYYTLRFSPDSQHLTYVATLNGPEGMGPQSFRVVVDGVERTNIVPGPGESVGNPLLSPDGKRVAYILQRGSNGPSAVVLDGKVGPAHAGSISQLTFSANGQHLAYAVMDTRTNTNRLVVDGREGPDGGSFDSFQLSADGTHFAYVAQVGPLAQACVTEAGVGKGYITITNLILSPDGTHVAYLARRADGPAVVVRDGREEKPYMQIVDRSLQFSADGKRLAYRVMSGGGMAVVADGVEGKAYGFNGSVPGIAFSPDDRHVAYVAQRRDDSKGILVVDGVESAPFDQALEAPVVFDRPNHVHVLASRGGMLIRLEADVPDSDQPRPAAPSPGTNPSTQAGSGETPRPADVPKSASPGPAGGDGPPRSPESAKRPASQAPAAGGAEVPAPGGGGAWWVLGLSILSGAGGLALLGIIWRRRHSQVASSSPPPLAEIKQRCLNCERIIKIPRDMAGKAFSCPDCGAAQVARRG